MSGRARLFLVLGALYAAQAIPSYLLVAALPPILREQGVSLSTIGFMSFLMLPLVLKFLWAPVVDAVRPFAWGHRRAWILPTQIGTILAILALGLGGPTDVLVIFCAGFAIALLASTQDIATDGYATRLLRPRDRPLGNAIQAGSVAFGVIVGGTFSLLVYDRFGWEVMILVAAGLSVLPLLALPLMREDTAPPRRAAGIGIGQAFKDFFARREAVLVLSVALIYRASEGMVKSMENPYLVDAGLPLSAIGYLSGFSAATAGLAGAAIAVAVLRRLGTMATLVLLGTARTICFAMFALHAAGLVESLWFLIAAAAFQTMLRYMEIVALYNLFMAVASPERPGTDFSLLACAQLVVYMVGAATAGRLADLQGYGALFFLATALSLAAVIVTATILSRCPRAIRTA